MNPDRDDVPIMRTAYVCDHCKGSTPYVGEPPTTCGVCGQAVRVPADADPDRACVHDDFQTYVAIQRVQENPGGPVIAFSAELQIECIPCGEKFRFTGLPAGVSPAHPTVSVDEMTLYAPIRPASADPDFGMGIPGFSIGYRGPLTPEDQRNYGPLDDH